MEKDHKKSTSRSGVLAKPDNPAEWLAAQIRSACGGNPTSKEAGDWLLAASRKALKARQAERAQAHEG